MLSHIVCVLLFCTLMHAASFPEWNHDLQLQRSRSYMSEAKVKSIQDILLLQDSYPPNTPHIQQNLLPSHGYSSHQKHGNPLAGPQHLVSDSSWYSPNQEKGYEIYEESDEPGSNVEKSEFQRPNSGYLGRPSSILSKRKANLQFHQIYGTKTTDPLENAFGVSESGGVSSYQRQQGHLNNKEVQSPASRVTQIYQTFPTQFQRNLSVLPKPRAWYGQYPGTLPGLTAHGVNPLTAVILASSLGIQTPVVA